MSALEEFARNLQRRDLVQHLRRGLIGDGVKIDGPDGPKPLVYADYVASGRALKPVEDFITEHVLPYYANSHTEASFCGAYTTRLREEARAQIARLTGAAGDCSVVFTGSGATAAINRVIRLLNIEQLVTKGRRVRILVGPYEHHSNYLPWVETGAEVEEIPEATNGGPDLARLEQRLQSIEDYDLVVGSFSAASNVTGILTPVDAVTTLLKKYGALAIWDFAGGAPYVEMDMGAGASAKDAIVYSSHKFPGGPGASGVLVLRDTIVRRDTPTASGGGTVVFVSPWRHVYSANVVAREEAGTPNIIGDIRAALVMLIKSAVSQQFIDQRDRTVRARALAAWQDHPRIDLLGNKQADRTLPIFAFRIRSTDGGFIHHQLFTRMLSDFYGIQVRGGCACAGPYAHRLLDIDRASSNALFSRIEQGEELRKPGWVRLNFSYLMDDEKVAYIIDSVNELASTCEQRLERYTTDESTARFTAVPQAVAV